MIQHHSYVFICGCQTTFIITQESYSIAKAFLLTPSITGSFVLPIRRAKTERTGKSCPFLFPHAFPLSVNRQRDFLYFCMFYPQFQRPSGEIAGNETKTMHFLHRNQTDKLLNIPTICVMINRRRSMKEICLASLLF